MAIVSNLFIDQGTDYTAYVNLQNVAGDAFELTDFQVSAQIRKSYTSTTYYEFLTAISDAENGIAQIRLPAATSAGMKPGRYVYDVEVVSPNGIVYRIVEGIVDISPNVTR